jgi:hypothetical protein
LIFHGDWFSWRPWGRARFENRIHFCGFRLRGVPVNMILFQPALMGPPRKVNPMGEDALTPSRPHAFGPQLREGCPRGAGRRINESGIAKGGSSGSGSKRWESAKKRITRLVGHGSMGAAAHTSSATPSQANSSTIGTKNHITDITAGRGVDQNFLARNGYG